MKRVLTLITTLMLGLFSFANQSLGKDSEHGLRVTSFTDDHSSIKRLDKYECTVTLDKSWGNPFDHIHQVELNAYFSLPGGGISRVPGFWYEGFSRTLHANTERLKATKLDGWKFRFSPKTTGVFQYYIEIIDHENNHKSLRYPSEGFLTFTATPSSDKGFLVVGKIDKTYLEYEDGSRYIGLGHNFLGWEWSGNSNSAGTYDYDRWLERMSKNKANMAQFDFCEGDQLEWTAHPTELPYSSSWQGIGRYNQKVSWKMDYIISEAEQLGIFFRLCFSHWEDFDHETKDFPKWGWNRNPYHSDNGGPVTNVTHFFEDPAAKDYYKRYLRYIVARWDYSKNILAYELWNEADAPKIIWGEGNDYNSNQQNILAWHREMSDYLKKLDPHHLVTTSFADNLDQPSVWELSNIDLTTIHRYPHFNQWIDGNFKQFEVEDCLTYLIQKRATSQAKPLLIGEFTVSPHGKTGTHQDPEGIAFHNQLWVSIMQGALGTAMHWQWDHYIDAFDLYHHYKPLAAFLEGEDFRNMNAYSYRNGAANGYGRKSPDRAYLWLHDAKHTFIDREHPHDLITGQTHELVGMENGKYAVRFYETYSGAMISEQTLKCESGGLLIPIPDFRKDTALKVKKIQGS